MISTNPHPPLTPLSPPADTIKMASSIKNSSPKKKAVKAKGSKAKAQKTPESAAKDHETGSVLPGQKEGDEYEVKEDKNGRKRWSLVVNAEEDDEDSE